MLSRRRRSDAVVAATFGQRVRTYAYMYAHTLYVFVPALAHNSMIQECKRDISVAQQKVCVYVCVCVCVCVVLAQ